MNVYRPVNIEWRLTVGEAEQVAASTDDPNLREALLGQVELIKERGRAAGALVVGHYPPVSVPKPFVSSMPREEFEARYKGATMRPFYTQVVVHGVVPAENAGDAIGLLCTRIREGIGPEGEEGREWDVAIAASTASTEGEQPHVLVNEEFVRRRGI